MKKKLDMIKINCFPIFRVVTTGIDRNALHGGWGAPSISAVSTECNESSMEDDGISPEDSLSQQPSQHFDEDSQESRDSPDLMDEMLDKLIAPGDSISRQGSKDPLEKSLSKSGSAERGQSTTALVYHASAKLTGTAGTQPTTRPATSAAAAPPAPVSSSRITPAGMEEQAANAPWASGSKSSGSAKPTDRDVSPSKSSAAPVDAWGARATVVPSNPGSKPTDRNVSPSKSGAAPVDAWGARATVVPPNPAPKPTDVWGSKAREVTPTSGNSKDTQATPANVTDTWAAKARYVAPTDGSGARATPSSAGPTSAASHQPTGASVEAPPTAPNTTASVTPDRWLSTARYVGPPASTLTSTATSNGLPQDTWGANARVVTTTRAPDPWASNAPPVTSESLFSTRSQTSVVTTASVTEPRTSPAVSSNPTGVLFSNDKSLAPPPAIPNNDGTTSGSAPWNSSQISIPGAEPRPLPQENRDNNINRPVIPPAPINSIVIPGAGSMPPPKTTQQAASRKIPLGINTSGRWDNAKSTTQSNKPADPWASGATDSASKKLPLGNPPNVTYATGVAPSTSTSGNPNTHAGSNKPTDPWASVGTDNVSKKLPLGNPPNISYATGVAPSTSTSGTPRTPAGSSIPLVGSTAPATAALPQSTPIDAWAANARPGAPTITSDPWKGQTTGNPNLKISLSSTSAPLFSSHSAPKPVEPNKQPSGRPSTNIGQVIREARASQNAWNRRNSVGSDESAAPWDDAPGPSVQREAPREAEPNQSSNVQSTVGSSSNIGDVIREARASVSRNAWTRRNSGGSDESAAPWDEPTDPKPTASEDPWKTQKPTKASNTTSQPAPSKNAQPSLFNSSMVKNNMTEGAHPPVASNVWQRRGSTGSDESAAPWDDVPDKSAKPSKDSDPWAAGAKPKHCDKGISLKTAASSSVKPGQSRQQSLFSSSSTRNQSSTGATPAPAASSGWTRRGSTGSDESVAPWDQPSDSNTTVKTSKKSEDAWAAGAKPQKSDRSISLQPASASSASLFSSSKSKTSSATPASNPPTASNVWTRRGSTGSDESVAPWDQAPDSNATGANASKKSEDPWAAGAKPKNSDRSISLKPSSSTKPSQSSQSSLFNSSMAKSKPSTVTSAAPTQPNTSRGWTRRGSTGSDESIAPWDQPADSNASAKASDKSKDPWAASNTQTSNRNISLTPVTTTSGTRPTQDRQPSLFSSSKAANKGQTNSSDATSKSTTVSASNVWQRRGSTGSNESAAPWDDEPRKDAQQRPKPPQKPAPDPWARGSTQQSNRNIPLNQNVPSSASSSNRPQQASLFNSNMAASKSSSTIPSQTPPSSNTAHPPPAQSNAWSSRCRRDSGDSIAPWEQDAAPSTAAGSTPTG